MALLENPRNTQCSTNEWSYNSVPIKNERLFDRGFTGHEHLDLFGLINMPPCRSISGGRNGRTYDPWLGRMLQPDNFVQDGGYSQSYNRYSYAYNNPLKYNDPSGEFIQYVIGAAIGGVVGYVSGRSAGLRGGELAMYTLTSAGIGAVSGGIGAGAGSAVNAGGSAFVGGMISGAAGGAAGGFIGGVGMTAMNNTFLETSQNVVIGGFKGAAIGAAFGGVTNGLVKGLKSHAQGRDFWTGEGTLEFKVSGNSNYQKAQALAKNYNGSFKQKVDTDLLHELTKSKFGISEGELGIRKLTSHSGRYGINSKGYFVNPKGQNALGYVHCPKYGRFSDVHIAPSAINGSVKVFEATVGHELLHVVHHNIFGKSFNKQFSEAVAYRHTANVLFSHGDFRGGSNMLIRGNSWAVWSNIPDGYHFRTPLYWP